MRSVTIGRDLLFWKKAEFVASGIASDLAAVTHLTGCLADARRELEAAAEVVFQAEQRLLTVAVEKRPG